LTLLLLTPFLMLSLDFPQYGLVAMICGWVLNSIEQHTLFHTNIQYCH
jgi:hypothetical protein